MLRATGYGNLSQYFSVSTFSCTSRYPGISVAQSKNEDRDKEELQQ